MKSKEIEVKDSAYLKQGDDTSCILIAMLNAFVHKFGKSPVKYPSSDYDLLLQVGGGVAGPVLDPQTIGKILGIELIPPPSWVPLDVWIRTCTIEHHNPVMLPIRVPVGKHHYGHAVLVTDVSYRRNHLREDIDRLKCVNSQLVGQKVDWHSWAKIRGLLDIRSATPPYEVIVKEPYQRSSKKRKAKIRRKK